MSPSEDFEFGHEILAERKQTKRGKRGDWQEALMPSDEAAPVVEAKQTKLFFQLLYFAAGLLFLILVGRLWDLQIKNAGANRALAEGNRIRKVVISAPRGIIFDRNGVPLVRNKADYNLTAVPADLPKDPAARDREYAQVASLAGLPAAEVKSKAEVKGFDFYDPVPVGRNIPRQQAIDLQASVGKLAGFDVNINPIREYINNINVSHILGYVGAISEEELKNHPDYLLTDYLGKDGMEKQYESVLRGKDGAKIVEVDALGKVVRTIGPPVDPVPGGNIYLTIDISLQNKTAESLQAALNRGGQTKGSAVAIDPRNGQVLAAVSLPTYDNNLFARGIKPDEYARLAADPNQPLFFRPFQGEYPSGSTIKPFLAVGGLDEGVINEHTTINSTGGITVGNFFFPDARAGGYGVTDVRKGIAQSVNSFFYAVGGGYGPFHVRGLGIRAVDKWLTTFGFGAKTGIDFPEEASGLVPTPEWKKTTKPAECGLATPDECWYLGDTYHLSIGQGDFTLTPLQLAVATVPIANQGTLYQPELMLKATDDNGIVTKTAQPVVIRRQFAAAHSFSVVVDGMRDCVLSGTCKRIAGLPVPAAGKTGTAEYGPLNKQGQPSLAHAWGDTFAPYNNPQVVMVVQIEAGGRTTSNTVVVTSDALTPYFSK